MFAELDALAADIARFRAACAWMEGEELFAMRQIIDQLQAVLRALSEGPDGHCQRNEAG